MEREADLQLINKRVQQKSSELALGNLQSQSESYCKKWSHHLKGNANFNNSESKVQMNQKSYMDNRRARKANQVGLKKERRVQLSDCEEYESSQSDDEMHVMCAQNFQQKKR